MNYCYEYGYSFMSEGARGQLARLGNVRALGGFFANKISPCRVVLFHIPPPPPGPHPLRPHGTDYMVCYVGVADPAATLAVRYSGTFVQGHLRQAHLDKAVLAGQLRAPGAGVASPVNFGTADTPLYLCFNE